ncbi:ClpXP protease specificity-enhancing factor [Marinobacterium sp. LSUCC0821]|uniref:ClpXP protease specificity-enhancing factor n=1 Tax=Marinobacterium sp. LSUCC0821 TaxID=2668067 RepID=UPI0014522006|nr:ClpXP protease specificity-enhancing factor [Marinobacterium sp. LSUCC0821]
MSDITPSRAYLLRALYEWLLDNDLTPHVAVDSLVKDTDVPQQFVNDGQITLNIAPGAVRDLHIDNEAISFNARFAGQPTAVYLPMASILAIFARESGVGMGFGMEPGAEPLNLALERAHNGGDGDEGVTTVANSDSKTESKPKAFNRPGLRVVK